MVQQIRKLTIDKYIEDHENDENPIKFKEDKNTIISNLTLLDFIIDYDINIKEEVEYITKIENEEMQIKLSLFIKIKQWWKEKSNFSKKWFICKVFALIGCIIISTGLGLIPTTIILGISAIKPIAISVSLGLGFIAIPWNNIRNRIVDWVFGKKRKKIEDTEEFKKMKKDNEKLKNDNKNLWKVTINKLTETEKIEIISNKFHEFLNRNKDISDDVLSKWLSNKIDERNKNWTQEQLKKIEATNEKWNEFKNKLQEPDSWQLVYELKTKIEYNQYGKIKNILN